MHVGLLLRIILGMLLRQQRPVAASDAWRPFFTCMRERRRDGRPLAHATAAASPERHLRKGGARDTCGAAAPAAAATAAATAAAAAAAPAGKVLHCRRRALRRQRLRAEAAASVLPLRLLLLLPQRHRRLAPGAVARPPAGLHQYLSSRLGCREAGPRM